jgi:heterotetrameric sarcosine oxidase delta subunit
MSPFLIECPHCGPREAPEFSFGGEVVARPVERPPSRRELSSYLYFRGNAAGPQREWWFHSAGCGRWIVATRDTRLGGPSATEPAPGAEPGAPR